MDKSIARVHRIVKTALGQSGLGNNAPIVVAVSGGPDSLSLLYSLSHLRQKLGLRLYGVHVNHHLRGDDSNADARFVADTFNSLGIAFDIKEVDVAAFRRERRMSLEEAARTLRYGALAETAREQNTYSVALGHTLDDQAETVLMHVLRGSGTTGLRGMETTSRRTVQGTDLLLVRPLLNASRGDTIAYCRAMNLEPREDASNLDTTLFRNRVRLELIPLLESYNPAIKDALARLSRSASQDLALIEDQVATHWGEVVRQEHGDVVLDRGRFLSLAPAVRSHLLRRAILTIKHDLEDVEQSHIESMSRLMNGRAGTSLDLPGRITFSVGYDHARIGRSRSGSRVPVPLPEGEMPLNVPGETTLPGWRVNAHLKEPSNDVSQPFNEQGHVSDVFTKFLDYDALGEGLSVRRRKPGDRFQPSGMQGTKKLQDFMVDAKVPREIRDGIPLVISSRGIAWIVGYRTAEWAREKESSRRTLELTFQRIEFSGAEG